jgi:Uma2 family endonuclease
MITVEELWALSHLPENAGKHFDLIEGVLVEMPPAGWEHGEIALEIGAHIYNHVRLHKLGRVTAAETGYILSRTPARQDDDAPPQGASKDVVLAPDVGFITADRAKDLISREYVPFAPDLAVEVVSSGNSTEEITEKVELYLKYGTRLVWVLYLSRQKVHVYRPQSAGQASVTFLSIDHAVDGESVLPGFSVSVRNLFERN